MSNVKNPNKKQIETLIKKNKSVRKFDILELFKKIQTGDKNALAKGITLVESNSKNDNQLARQLVGLALPVSGKSIRIGITGVPGVGKSTFIESFGAYLISQNKKVAVLAIDPSSEKTKGSILGDKTRMNHLASNPSAFIRPSASSGSLGGVANHTRESILLCEAAGYDVILIETVGVGQSETVVHSMSDIFILLMLAGAGDELQGIKRGIMEMADILLINKADGDNLPKANLAKAQYKNALHLFPANENNWIPQTETISSIENVNIDKVWKHVQSFELATKTSGWFEQNRKNQQHFWMKEIIRENVLNDFFQSDVIKKQIKKITKQVENGEITSADAAHKLITLYHGKKKI